MKTPASVRIRSKRAIAARIAERQFVASVAAARPTQDTEVKAAALVRQARSAKQASFLDQYRVKVAA